MPATARSKLLSLTTVSYDLQNDGNSISKSDYKSKELKLNSRVKEVRREVSREMIGEINNRIDGIIKEINEVKYRPDKM